MDATSPATCPLCNASTPTATGRTHIDRGVTYTQYECQSCLVQFWWPLKNPGAAWYTSHEKYGTRNADPVWEPTVNHLKTLAYLKGRRGSVLDVGCGIGNFLSAAKEQGWRVAGIDFDPDSIASAKKVTGVDDFEATDVVSYAKAHPDKKFDLITFFDVLEHVDNHNEFIAAITSMLKPHGYIAMSMPYRRHAIWLMRADVPPMHLTCWDRRSLARFLESRGYDVRQIVRSSEGIWPIILKLRFKYGRAVSFGAVSAARKAAGPSSGAPGKKTLLVRLVHIAAKMKDMILFGIPALIIFTAMLPTPKRYIDLFCIAQKKS